MGNLSANRDPKNLKIWFLNFSMFCSIFLSFCIMKSLTYIVSFPSFVHIFLGDVSRQIARRALQKSQQSKASSATPIDWVSSAVRRSISRRDSHWSHICNYLRPNISNLIWIRGKFMVAIWSRLLMWCKKCQLADSKMRKTWLKTNIGQWCLCGELLGVSSLVWDLCLESLRCFLKSQEMQKASEGFSTDWLNLNCTPTKQQLFFASKVR